MPRIAEFRSSEYGTVWGRPGDQVMPKKPGEVNRMNDLISRQLVMKTLCERRCGDKPKGCPSGFCTESLAVDCIPSAKPQESVGEE